MLGLAVELLLEQLPPENTFIVTMALLLLRGRACLSRPSEKKTGFLMIDTLKKLFNPHDYGHQGSVFGSHSYMSVSKNFKSYE